MLKAIGLSATVATLAASLTAMASADDARVQERNAEYAADDARSVDRATVRLNLSPASLKKAVDARLLPAGTKSLLRVKTRLQHGEYIWNDEDVPPGEVTVFVDVRRQMMSVFRGGHEIGTSVVVYGEGNHKSPEGKFPILSKFEDYHSRTYDAPMPHSMFLTNDGVAIHGNVMAAFRATKGCIGLPPEFAKLLFSVARKGDVVEITRSLKSAT